jgi:hypothetical protein
LLLLPLLLLPLLHLLLLWLLWLLRACMLLLLLMQPGFRCHEGQVHLELPHCCIQRQPWLLQHLVVTAQQDTAT